ncbi:MAG: ribosomal protein [Pseudomonadota bacterium]|jgi:large subunit ribosomal protein L24|nr:50S ribosomal protein L24 [Burkholderiales bacterium]
MKKIRKGDQVIVIAGNDKGKTGEVLQILNNDRVVVSGVAVAKKHTKPNPAKSIVGGILDKNLPIHISNVAIYNSETKKADRVGIKQEEQGQKIRVFKSNGKQVG